MPNGGFKYGSDRIQLCVQGDMNMPSGIVAVSTSPPYDVEQVVNSYHGRPFSSPNDVVVSANDGSIWFTDPPYGYNQGFRPPPELPPQVYRFDGRDGSIRAVADGLTKPNGLCFSPDEGTLYITDTACISGRSWATFSPAQPGGAHIYAYTVLRISGQSFLINKRLFAHADNGVPDGIKCDSHGNVYSGCGDGIHVWNHGGVLLGKILVEGGVANFCFGEEGEFFIGGETKLWYARLRARSARTITSVLGQRL
ncbi:hypothetical protein LTR10_013237 [Elasticomyces elasticus]|uniref:SMP-30/Gluconolactonase/LRE-like region domain-containing protein n=1 Tax=Exophiala sideris TaxID=1016849 RepID=A0ABR0JD75_9EURO|nr:hypothetical protein LTR10_013237 [Elasticomyces elasticus]KAK5030616.1 hypothetical protein LTS07_005400 [Exophiala sideris]KAK5038670.1 hypothetical protein LTR13_004417 [Exophiala sideris]KAK5060551.1 hypothetical protein LTR69_005868 [Exophiala sideris]KAK5183463.1 hypothetical protein LTR44_004464 [Eurotiomycetes sp. CCFEE 6388]